MDLGSMLDDLLPGGADGVLSALEVRGGRVPRAARAAAPKEWPPACPSGLCGTQGCVCRTRERASEDLACLDIGIDLVTWAQLDEFGSMIPPAKPPVSVSPARTVAAPGKRGRGRPRKRPLKEPSTEHLLGPPKPSPVALRQSLVEDVAAALHYEARSQLSHKRLRSLEPVLRPSKARSRVAKAFSSRSLASLVCGETLEDCMPCELDFTCYETLSMDAAEH